MRFFVKDREQQDCLIEAIKYVKRLYITTAFDIEHEGEASEIRRWADFFLDKFSVFPAPVFWNVEVQEKEMLVWMLNNYGQENKAFFNPKPSEVAKTILSVKDNFHA